MDEYLTIKINILQRPYSVRVRLKDEAIFRQACNSIEDSVQRYAEKGATYRDQQDLLAMALLESTVSSLKNKEIKEDSIDKMNIFEKLKCIDDFLSFNLEKD